ncbi:ATP-binding protein [Pseudacidovorax intermedius]|uniref:ATP-binding protein n=1 Tax=Pseudacidovorax intermedius TaxID=433924 RepID=UPI0009DC2A72|nr:4Fe-4S dicluster domain-containing protein [Pseudacidovorax intermedius]
MASDDPPASPRDSRHRPGWLPLVDAARCTGCGWCVATCPPHVLSLESRDWKKQAVLHDAPACTGCSDCAVVCPFHAIAMRRVAAAGPRVDTPSEADQRRSPST